MTHLAEAPTLPDLMRMPEVSELLGVPVNTLRSWRQRHIGPASARLGGHVVYRRADLLAWIDAQFAAEARESVA